LGQASPLGYVSAHRVARGYALNASDLAMCRAQKENHRRSGGRWLSNDAVLVPPRAMEHPGGIVARGDIEKTVRKR